MACFLTVIFLILPLTSCKDAIEVDELVYVASIGIDQGVSDYWRLSVKYPIMRNTGQDQPDQSGSSSKGEGNEYNVVAMDAPSFYTGVDMIDSSIARHLNFQHIKFIVISEDIARSGSLGKYLAPIVRSHEIRRTANILICKGSAKEFLEKNKPPLGSSLTKNMEDWIIQMGYTGFYTNTTLKDFYNKIKSPYQHPTAILAAQNEGENFIENGQKTKKAVIMKSEYTAGQLPVAGGNDVELFGCALFNGDKMVETLNGYETRLMLMVEGESFSGSFTFPDPKAKDMVVTVEIKPEKKPYIKVDLSGDNPRIFVKLRLSGQIMGMQSELNYEGRELKPVLEKAIASEIKKDLDILFNKCKAIGEDVFGFGGVAARQFATAEQWEQYNWFKHFKDAEINTEVELNIKRSGTFIKTNPIISTEGEK
jgi:spore germination protein KC